MLGLFWFGLIAIGFGTALYKTLFLHDLTIFGHLVQAMFDMSKLGFDIALGLTGLLALWLGLFKIAEASGLARYIAKFLEPLLIRLMPQVPKGDPAIAAITMNLGANVLGLDNAATPLGIKAMKALNRLNPTPTIATNAQILFLVLNTSSVTLIPMTIFLYRAQQGSPDPTAVFIPIVFATSCSTLAGIIVTGWIQRLPLFNPVVAAYLGGYILFLTSVSYLLLNSDSDTMGLYSSLMGNGIVLSIVMLILSAGVRKRLDVYELFIIGAKQGFAVALRIVPYLIAMLFAIGLFRASGALDATLQFIRALVELFSIDSQFVDALPTALMKPLSGSGARAIMLETMAHHGVDSFAGKLAATFQGSTETTLYVLAVYFGSVGIQNIRHALFCGLMADLAGIICAIVIGYWFFL